MKNVLAVAAIFVVASLGQLECKVSEIVGCFKDFEDGRRAWNTIVWDGGAGEGAMTQEKCAVACRTLGQGLSGVEYGCQCFCGSENPPSEVRPVGECHAMKCAGDSKEYCGAANRMLVFKSICTGRPVPHGHSCLSESSYSWCDPNLDVGVRIDALVSALTLDEKLGLVGPDPDHNTCAFLDHGVKRFGIPPYLHLIETNTAAASMCVGPDKCATTFAAPASLAASFNASLWRAKGEVVSTEMRVLNNLGWHRGVGFDIKVGLEGYGPNINIVRDPRFGRNCEIPSEDPLLAGSYATEYVRGCQGGAPGQVPSTGYRMIAGLKHFAAYSVEESRDRFNGIISTFDLFDSYLPHFRQAFVEGGAMMAMGSYASINGVPSCANNFLLNDLVRTRWKRPEVLVGSDCGALLNMVHASHWAKDSIDAAAKALNSGLDQELGSTYFTSDGSLKKAIAQNRTTVAHLDAAAWRALHKRFITGQFDPLDSQPLTKLGIESINTPFARQTNFESAVQGLVLLKNDQALPFRPGMKIAVVGPHAVSRGGLLEDYAGDRQCNGGGDWCIKTIGEAVTEINGAASTFIAKGVDISSEDESGIPAALSAVSSADVVLLCVGLDTSQEHEAIDRVSITLPGRQELFARKVFAQGRSVVLVVISGGAVAFEGIASSARAIIVAFYPSMRGAEALARSVFGENRWGKLPVSIYRAEYVKQLQMSNMSISEGIGRTYRYYSGTPLFTFGQGLSYSKFDISCTASGMKPPATISCTVKNVDPAVAGDEVLQLYHRAGEDVRAAIGNKHPVPKRRLVDFQRLSISANQKQTIVFTVTEDMLRLVNAYGDRILYPGSHFIDVSNGNDFTASIEFFV